MASAATVHTETHRDVHVVFECANYLCVCVCVDKGWSSWLGWSPCSVTCGGVGVRKRKRECSSPPQCRMACSGPSEETERCAAENTCPGNIDVIHALRVHRLICVESFGGTGVFLIKVKGKWCVLLLKRFSKVFPILSSHLSPVSPVRFSPRWLVQLV